MTAVSASEDGNGSETVVRLAVLLHESQRELPLAAALTLARHVLGRGCRTVAERDETVDYGAVR